MKTLTRAAAARAPPRLARRPIQRALPRARQALPRKCEAPTGAGSFACTRASVRVCACVCVQPELVCARACACSRSHGSCGSPCTRRPVRMEADAAECPAADSAARTRDAPREGHHSLSLSPPLSYPTGGESALALCSLSTKNPRHSRAGQEPASAISSISAEPRTNTQVPVFLG